MMRAYLPRQSKRLEKPQHILSLEGKLGDTSALALLPVHLLALGATILRRMTFHKR